MYLTIGNERAELMNLSAIMVGVLLLFCISNVTAGQKPTTAPASKPTSQPAKAATQPHATSNKVEDIVVSPTLDEKQREVSAAINAKVKLELQGNPTTGYQWQVKNIKGKGATQAGEIKYVPSKAPQGIVGSGGVFVANFKVVGKEKTEIEFVYVRPWEEDVEPIKTFKLVIESF